MGGFAAISNRAHGQNLKKMMDQIKHRGSFMQGYVDLGHVLLAQNYHKADIVGRMEAGQNTARCHIPVSEDHKRGLHICYGGQVGNRPELAGSIQALLRTSQTRRCGRTLGKMHA